MKMSTSIGFMRAPLSRSEFESYGRKFDTEVAKKVAELERKGITTSKLRSVHAIRKACRAAGTSFLDASFPPGEASLYGGGGQPRRTGAETDEEAKPAIWQRARDFMLKGSDGSASSSNNLMLFGQTVHPCGIHQG